MILEFCSETSTGTEWVTENQCQELLTTLCCLPRPLPLQQIPKNCSKLSSNFVLCKDKPSPRAVKAGSQWAEKDGQMSCKMSFWCGCHKKKCGFTDSFLTSLKKKKNQQTRIVHLLGLLHSPSHLTLQSTLYTHFTEDKTENQRSNQSSPTITE